MIVAHRPQPFVLKTSTPLTSGYNMFSAAVAAGYNGRRDCTVINDAPKQSTSTGTPAVRRGSFEAALTPVLWNRSDIDGAGGLGPAGGLGVAGSVGTPGGVAISATEGRLRLNNALGRASGGGGSGGSGDGSIV